jgi:glycerophosphoryl diester phosphodiesterase
MLKYIHILLIITIAGCANMPSGNTLQPEKRPQPVFRSTNEDGSTDIAFTAHRCGGGIAPENTCKAVLQSSFFIPDFYEIDVRHTSDNVPVCFHDETLDRTTNLEGKISGTSLEEIKRADAGSWLDEEFSGTRAPTFEEIVDCTNPSPLMIEIKEAEITVEQIEYIVGILNTQMDESSVIASFHKEVLDRWKSVEPDRRTIYITAEWSDDLVNMDADAIALNYRACNSDMIGRIQESGKALWVWTVNEDFLKFVEMGVDGIITDYPDRLRQALPKG